MTLPLLDISADEKEAGGNEGLHGRTTLYEENLKPCLGLDLIDPRSSYYSALVLASIDQFDLVSHINVNLT